MLRLINQGTTAQKRAASQDNPRSKNAADPNAETSTHGKTNRFTCLPDKLREWSRPGHKDGSTKFAVKAGVGATRCGRTTCSMRGVTRSRPH
eukprot:1187133-Pyramimonas_sp.AAC.1